MGMGRDEDGGCGIGYIARRYQGRWISASSVLDGGFAYGVCGVWCCATEMGRAG